ncbi:TorF family putative porin [Pseudomonas sp. QS1027]|uniref:TorF family putative porin n=1 Tax=unclassified Pseudomonas TaxID=196821 RepID=UPI000C2F9CD2
MNESTVKNNKIYLSVLGLLSMSSVPSLARADDGIASYALDVTAKVASDVRNRGTSDSLNGPGARVSFTLAHESGLVALAEFTTVSDKEYLNSDGYNVLLGGGYRFGDPDAGHYGLGLAAEFFPGGKYQAPSRFDFENFVPTDERTTNYNGQFAVLELGYGALEARIATVISKTYRGTNTSGVCGTMLQYMSDPTDALKCYARGDRNSRGSMLYDLDYKYELMSATTLKLHAGYQQIKNFSEASFYDYGVGVVHRFLGFDWGLDWVSPRTRVRALFIAQDGDHERATDENKWVLSVSRHF